MGTRFTLAEFSEVFQIRNAHGQPYVLIGGQAVNYWAERYLAGEPGLQKHSPFTSEDIDFRGNREDVQRIAGQLKLTPVFPHRIAMTALAGAIPFRIGGVESNIEVVRAIPGVPAATVEAVAIHAEWDDRKIRVLDPVSLLACKLELALTIPQQKRQDVEHLKILLICVRGFLRELLAEVERKSIPAKGWLGTVNRLLRLAKSAPARKAENKFGIRWRDVLPIAEIQRSSDPKILRFWEEQFSRFDSSHQK